MAEGEMGEKRSWVIDHRGSKIEMTLVNSQDDLPEGVRRFAEELFGWLRRENMVPDGMTLDDLIKRFPTTLLRIGRFTFCLQGGGEENFGDVLLTTFNENGMAVDGSMYAYSFLGMPFPSRSHHGARIVDGNNPMVFTPMNPQRKPFVPPK